MKGELESFGSKNNTERKRKRLKEGEFQIYWKAKIHLVYRIVK